MDNADFINMYVETLNKNLHDFVSRNVVLETRLAAAEKAVASLNVELEQTKQQLEKLTAKKIKSDTGSIE